MIRLDRVAKRYRGSYALGPLSIELSSRTTTALVGPSGAGKSTLLRLIVGLLAPDEGQVFVGGELLTPQNVRAVRRRMGLVLQDGGLFPHLTARANATLLARHLPRGEGARDEGGSTWTSTTLEARVQELGALVRLPPALLDRYPAELSGGERQRVSLLRALFLDPDVLLLDEPFGALDVLVRAELQYELREVVRQLQKTVVLVTHDLAEAAALAEDLVVMKDGVVEDRGTFDELRSRTADSFSARFISASHGLPRMAPSTHAPRSRIDRSDVPPRRGEEDQGGR